MASVAPEVMVTSRCQSSAMFWCASIVRGDGLAQLGQAAHGRILVGAVERRARGGFEDVARAVLLGKALAQIDRAALGGEARHHFEHGGAECGVDAVHRNPSLPDASKPPPAGVLLAGRTYMKTFFLAAALALSLAAPAAAQTRPFDPRAYQRQHVGEPTQILVLGTSHLSETPDSFDPAVLEPLLDRLAAFRPDAITIEALPGMPHRVDVAVPPELSRGGEHVRQPRHDDGGLARAGVDLDMPDAEAEVRRTLSEWPASPTPEQRRRLAALFAASGDPDSALVQWWRLDPAERIADDNVTALLGRAVRGLRHAAQREPSDRRAPRRRASGLSASIRWTIKAMTPGPDFMADFEPYVRPMYEAQREDPAPRLSSSRAQRMTTPAETLATYRMLNTAAAGQWNADWQWLPMLNRPSPRDVGRTTGRVVGGAQLAHGGQHPRSLRAPSGRARAGHRRLVAQAVVRRLSRA